MGQFSGPVDKIGLVNDFAKNERVFLRWHITLISVTPNGVMPKLGASYAGWPNAKWRSLERMKGLAGARDLTARRQRKRL
jgi:hypothetical protein